MLVTKLIETRLDIKDTNSIFCINYDEMLLRLIREKFNNKCYKSTYINNVEKIVKRSNIHCKNKVLDGSFYVDILFEATCLIYEKGEVIHKCKIIQINNSIIHAKSEFASLHVKNLTKIDIFKENEEIPVIVNTVRYILFDSEMAISAIPFVPLARGVTLYKIEDDEKNGDKKDIVAAIAKDIESLKGRLSKCNAKTVKFFRELIYPYTAYKNYTKLYKCEKRDIKKLPDVSVGSSVFTADKYLDEDMFYSCDEKNIPDRQPLSISKENFIIKILLENKKDLIQLIEFTENYCTPELIMEAAHLWKMYKALKK